MEKENSTNNDLREAAEALIQTAKEKGAEIIHSAQDQAQASVDQTRKKAIDILEQAKQKLEA